MRGYVNGLAVILTLIYPLAVYYGISFLQPREIALLLGGLVAVKWLTGNVRDRGSRWLTIVLVLYCAFSVFNNNPVSLLFYPVLVNLGLLTIFSFSLYFPPSLIERLARLNNPDLPEKSIGYTRRVTQVWCLFFLGNGLVATYTALWCSMAVWSLYNGLIAYVLIGSLMAGEYLIRIKTQDHGR